MAKKETSIENDYIIVHVVKNCIAHNETVEGICKPLIKEKFQR